MAHLVPGGAASTVWMILPVEPETSARSLTSCGHSGWTRILMPGCCSRNWCTCSALEHLVHAAVAFPEDRPCCRQAALRCCRPARRRSGSQTGICVVGDAHRQRRVAAQVLIGKEQHAAGALRRPISRPAPALLDVQTMPPCRPQNAFRLAAELMYVTGVMSAVSITSPSSSQAVFDLFDRGHVGHRTTGGHVGQDHRSPAGRRAAASFSGRLARMSAVSAMKCTPQKTM